MNTYSHAKPSPDTIAYLKPKLERLAYETVLLDDCSEGKLDQFAGYLAAILQEQLLRETEQKQWLDFYSETSKRFLRELEYDLSAR